MDQDAVRGFTQVEVAMSRGVRFVDHLLRRARPAHGRAGPRSGHGVAAVTPERSQRRGALALVLRRLALLSLGAFFAMGAQAQYTISQMPMLVAAPPPANIVLTIDDSGSMTYGYVPDYVGQYGSQAGFASSAYNSIYYNPAVQYPVPPDALGNQVPLARCSPYPPGCPLSSFTNAYFDGFNPDLGSVDLSQNYTVTLTMSYNSGAPPSVNVQTASAGTTGNPGPAFYYLFVPSASCVAPTPGMPPAANACYQQVTVSSTSGPAICTTGTGLIACASLPTGSQQNQVLASGWDETQNFANWFSFYRIRHLSLISAAATAMQSPSLANTRVAWQALNTCADNFTGTNCQGFRGTNFDDKISQFGGQHKAAFYNWLFQLPAGQSTPTRVAWWRAGNYFSNPNLGTNGPYGLDPNDPTNPQPTVTGQDLMCVYNFNVTLTDGLWNNYNENGDTSFCGINGQPANCGNADNVATTFPDGTMYVPATAPTPTETTIYGDGKGGGDTGIQNGGLADIAFYYWSTNLRPDLAHFYVPPYYAAQSLTNPQPSTLNPVSGALDPTYPYWNPVNDPATWPHMVNFTVGVGLTGFLQLNGLQWSGDAHSGAAYTNLQTAAPNCTNTAALNPDSPTCDWPPVDPQGSGNGFTGGLNGAGNVYDLWHAAINSRGTAFSSESPQDLISAMQAIFYRIEGQVHGNSAAAGSSPSLTASTTTDLFVASFDGTDWHGTVTAYQLDASGNVMTTPAWQTSAASIPAFNSRAVFTAKSALPASGIGITASPGIVFNTPALANAGLLIPANGWGPTGVNPNPVVNYLLGNPSGEQRNGGAFRNRPNTVLGDIVDSNPVYSWQENFGYVILPEGQGANGYLAFLAAKANRTPMVYAGANDGMLHGFNATNTASGGNEVFAYVPHTVIANMPALDSPNYLHHFYVDGPVFVGDAFFDNAWHSVLIGTTGAGGPGVFALDVTAPQSFSASDVLWDMDAVASGDINLGFTIGTPIIARLNDGNWAAVFGNGYLSARSCAVLYIVRLPGGQVQTIDTSGATPGTTTPCLNTGGTNPNGLGSPTLLDIDQNGTTDFVYAGDLQGHMWKFDLSSSNPSNWGVAYTQNSVPAPLFTATTSTGTPQPIVVAPNLGPSMANANAAIVYFPTGHLFATGDASDTLTQSIYAIEDQGSPITATLRHSLAQQTVIPAADGSGNENIQRPYTPVDLTVQNGWFIDLPNSGERALSTPLLVGGMVMFSTVIPQQQPCNGGCGGFIYALNQFNGDGGMNFLYDPTTNMYYDALATQVGCIKGLTLISKGGTLEWYASGNGVSFGAASTGSGTVAGAAGGPGNTGVLLPGAATPSSASIQHGAGNLSNSGRISWHEQIINQ